MKSRVILVASLIAAVLVFSPIQVEADKYKPLPWPRHFGTLVKDSTCPLATHALLRYCVLRPGEPILYIVFDRMKGVKKGENAWVTVAGPIIDTTSCSLPVIKGAMLEWKVPIPPPGSNC